MNEIRNLITLLESLEQEEQEIDEAKKKSSVVFPDSPMKRKVAQVIFDHLKRQVDDIIENVEDDLMYEMNHQKQIPTKQQVKKMFIENGRDAGVYISLPWSMEKEIGKYLGQIAYDTFMNKIEKSK